MKVLSLDVSGFRGFANSQQFDLSAEATIIVGSNGLGKTSLLDAIQWGIAGRLDRLEGKDENVLSLYSPTGQARVAIKLINDVKEITITRVFDGESKSQSVSTVIGDKEFKGQSATARIFEEIWPEANTAQDGIESLSSAMIRSVYLQQDRLRDFLENTTNQDRFNVISELVGAGRLTELQEQLEKESRSWTRASTQLEKELQPTEARVENLKNQLEKLKEESKLGSALDKSLWETWWKKSLDIKGVTTAQSPTATSSDAGTLLDRTIREIQSIRDSIKRRKSLAERMAEQLKNPPPTPDVPIKDIESKLRDAQNRVEAAKQNLQSGQEKLAEFRKRQVASKETDAQQRALAQLALQLLDEKCPVCQQDYDVDGTRDRLEQVIRKTDTSKSTDDKPDVDIEELANKEKLELQVHTKLQQQLSDAKRQQIQFDKWKNDCDEQLSELSVGDSKEPIKILQSIMNDCMMLDEELKQHAADGEALTLNLARESANARIKATEQDLNNAKNELKTQTRELTKRELTSTTTKILIEQLREARSKVAIQKLSEIEPLLQRIFARIDPHPAFKAVKFATDIVRGKGRLDTEVHDDSENKSTKTPGIIFSSSQLNALAVSVFLSFNLALPNLPLQAALLDDPIQSLDDINLLGLVDLLRRTKQKRQIIVSTHDP